MIAQEALQGWRRNLLCLVVAGLCWLALAAERSGEVALSVPVELLHVPPRLQVTSQVPPNITISVSGPRIAILRQQCRGLFCRLDLAGLPAGSAAFPALERNLDLDRELRVTRIAPASLSVTLAATRP